MRSTLASQRSDAYDLRGYQPIKDYAIIGDLHTVALVGKNGSIDWYCLPDIDSPSVFGRLLDYSQGGFFQIRSTDENAEHVQLYYPETNILLTRIATSRGMAEVTDFMPIKENTTQSHSLIREVFVTLGDLELTVTCRPAFDYARPSSRGRIIPTDYGALFCSSNLALSLSSTERLQQDKQEQGAVTATFTLRQGDRALFSLNSLSDPQNHFQDCDKEQFERLFEETFHYLRLEEGQYKYLFKNTYHYWHDWLNQCTYKGRWREIVQRSALALKLLTYAPTGAIVAAATTSLPELIGGERNWDYRYTWLRDAAFTLDSLLELGFTREARDFMNWLDKRCDKRDESGNMQIQPIYSIHGGTDLKEETLNLDGYAGSKPVRIGNEAYTQTQLDIYGELLDAIFVYNDRHEPISYDLWKHVQEILELLKEHWKEQDRGIWEIRGDPRTFLHSRLMCWVAFDRGIRIAQKWGWPAKLDEWEHMRTEIYQDIMDNGLHKQNGQDSYFKQCYDNDVVDASTLLMLLTHFVGPREPRMQTTLEQIQQELEFGPSILRYNPEAAADDGLKRSKEGAFSACSFWYVDCLARMEDHLDDARLRLERLLSLANHVGLYAEEIDSKGRPLGNFPQAFTHLTLIRACLTLDQAIEESLTRKH